MKYSKQKGEFARKSVVDGIKKQKQSVAAKRLKLDDEVSVQLRDTIN